MIRGIAAALIAASLWAAPAAAEVKAEMPWARATVAAQKVGGAYMTLTSPADDRLTGGESPLAETVEIHEHRQEGGMMVMGQVKGGLPLPAGQAVALAPGGYHVMLIGLKQALTKGSQFPLTLIFEKSGRQTVIVTVEAAGARAPMPHKH